MQANFACFLLLWMKTGLCMTGFDLSNNYTQNLEAHLRKKQSCVASSTTLLIVEPVTPAPSVTPIMAKTLRDNSIPAVANVPIGPTVNIGDGNFKLHTGLITIVQANPRASPTVPRVVR